MSTTKRLLLLTPCLLILGACADSTAPDAMKPGFDQQGGTPPNCSSGYHMEQQGSGGYLCVPNR